MFKTLLQQRERKQRRGGHPNNSNKDFDIWWRNDKCTYHKCCCTGLGTWMQYLEDWRASCGPLLRGPSSIGMRVVKEVSTGVSKGGSSLEGNLVLAACVADDLQVRTVLEALRDVHQPQQDFGPSRPPSWRRAPELGLRHDSLKTASISALLTTLSTHYGLLLTEWVLSQRTYVKAVCPCVLIFMALVTKF